MKISSICHFSNVKRVCTREVSDKMEKLANHSDMSQGIFVLINIDQRFFRQKKEEEEYSGFENGLERMEKRRLPG